MRVDHVPWNSPQQEWQKAARKSLDSARASKSLKAFQFLHQHRKVTQVWEGFKTEPIFLVHLLCRITDSWWRLGSLVLLFISYTHKKNLG